MKGDAIKITDVRTVLTAPANVRLVVVKVVTSEGGRFTVWAVHTFTQRARAVETAVDKYLRPFLIGKNPLNIEDLWQSNFVSSYWRNGPVLGNAISGVDMALWDILGKLARVCCGLSTPRRGSAAKPSRRIRHASRADARRRREGGARSSSWSRAAVRSRAQVSVPGLATYGAAGKKDEKETNATVQVWEPRAYVRTVPKLFEHLRKQLGDEVELLHDVHERIPPILAIQLAKDLEQFKLFFLEDPLSPEDIGYFEKLRAQTSTPIAMGELFNNPNEWVGLISKQLIDFIRIHISQVGGLTMARKVAALCEFFAVRTAWHGPPDVSPVGHAANVHLDLATPNFGGIPGAARLHPSREAIVFPGCPRTDRTAITGRTTSPGSASISMRSWRRSSRLRMIRRSTTAGSNVRKKDGTVVKP